MSDMQSRRVFQHFGCVPKQLLMYDVRVNLQFIRILIVYDVNK